MLYAEGPTPASGKLAAFLHDLTPTRVILLEKAELDEPIWLEEIQAALGQIARNKTLGMDGLQAEYSST
ncbi:hypothetical protein NDU88_002802 [Pleurodeles waltl]|uniref:Uncharacterized protein n=1 Tax=Pleurodeles waltl TaxID=8319 RepID=A0AAV7NEQ3_PLEWA|nr:hypothetical protein NDU88_002802 [Pleurodeles waltl]